MKLFGIDEGFTKTVQGESLVLETSREEVAIEDMSVFGNGTKKKEIVNECNQLLPLVLDRIKEGGLWGNGAGWVDYDGYSTFKPDSDYDGIVTVYWVILGLDKLITRINCNGEFNPNGLSLKLAGCASNTIYYHGNYGFFMDTAVKDYFLSGCPKGGNEQCRLKITEHQNIREMINHKWPEDKSIIRVADYEYFDTGNGVCLEHNRFVDRLVYSHINPNYRLYNISSNIIDFASPVAGGFDKYMINTYWICLDLRGDIINKDFYPMLVMGNKAQEFKPFYPTFSAGILEALNNTPSIKVQNSNYISFPYYDDESEVIINGLTYIVNEDGSIAVSGVSTDESEFCIMNGPPLLLQENEPYTLSIDISGRRASVYYDLYNSNDDIINSYCIEDVGAGKYSTSFISNQVDSVREVIRITFDSDLTVSNCLIKIQIEDGSASKYQVNKQSLINLEKSLRGYPVTQGGNFIDKNGVMWLCDTVDIINKKHIQRIAGHTIDTQNDDVRIDDWTYSVYGIEPCVKGGLSGSNVISNHGSFNIEGVGNCSVSKDTEGYRFLGIACEKPVIMYYPFDYYYTGWYSQHAKVCNIFNITRAIAQRNPLVFMYELNEPIITDLSASEIEAIDNLILYSPTTIIKSLNNLELSVTYGFESVIDFTSFIPVPSYTVNQEDKYKEWTDGSGVKHRSIYDKKYKGSLTLYFTEANNYFRFLDLIEATKKPDGTNPVVLYGTNVNEERRLDAYVTFNPSNSIPILNNSQNKGFTVDIEEP